MTEAEWLGSADPRAMVLWLKRAMRPRKFRLFVCACCRSLWDEVTPPQFRDAVQVLEDYADRRAGEQEREQARAAANQEAARLWTLVEGASGGWVQSLHTQARALWAAAWSAFPAAVDPQPWTGVSDLSPELQVRLLRDIFGNPYRTAALDPAWLSWGAGAVRGQAQAASDDRSLPGGTLDAGRLAVLADALEDAGCADRDLLDHCRSPGEHVRGCWALDLLLGRG
jgi:hypothetical protein